MMVSAGGLPPEYQQVEYLESTGTQYIDTGVNPSSNTVGFYINFLITGGGEQIVIGSRSG